MLSKWAARTPIQWLKKKKNNRRDNKEWYLILPNDSLKLKDIAKVKMG